MSAVLVQRLLDCDRYLFTQASSPARRVSYGRIKRSSSPLPQTSFSVSEWENEKEVGSDRWPSHISSSDDSPEAVIT